MIYTHVNVYITKKHPKNQDVLQFFSELFPKQRDFVNSDDYIRKITPKSIRLYLLFNSKLRYEVNEKLIFYSEEIRNSGNYIYDYAHSFI